ncbi:hypothetical protein LCGC14_2857010, partial [marine sediment metagenome]
ARDKQKEAEMTLLEQAMTGAFGPETNEEKLRVALETIMKGSHHSGVGNMLAKAALEQVYGPIKVDLDADPGLVDPWELVSEMAELMAEDERLIHEYGIDLGSAEGEYGESQYLAKVRALLERRI